MTDRNMRYFLDQDSSCHWYLVPAEIREEWDKWQELPEDCEEAWEPPEGAERIDGHPSWITFEKPVQE